MSATAPQPAQKPLPKVLRIGLAQDQKIVQERLMKVGESVTVGENSRNSFVITGTKLPPRFELFVARGDSYFLCVPDWVEGKISWKDGIRGLDELRQRGEAVKKGDIYQVPLNENVRGKVSIGATTLLFQFVPAPPEPVRAVSAADFRPRFFDGEDPLFQGLLGVFSLVAAAFMVWVYTTPPREHLDLDAVEDALDLVVDKKIDRIEITEDKPATDAPADKEVKKPDTKPEPKQEQTKTEAPQPATKESVARKSMLLQLIGTAGDAQGTDATNDILGDDASSLKGLDNALAGVSGVQEANQGNIGAKNGTAGGREDAKIGVGVVTGGSATTGAGAATAVKRPKVDYGDVDAEADAGDVSGVSTTVRKNQGRITSCLDQALKADPSTNGRISVGWSIVQGRVTEARLNKNTTGNDELGQCIVRAVRTIHFDQTLTAEVADFPWVVSGQ